MNTCKTCKEWRNKQRDLDYIEDYGICTGLTEYGEADIIKVKHPDDIIVIREQKNIINRVLRDHINILGIVYE